MRGFREKDEVGSGSNTVSGLIFLVVCAVVGGFRKYASKITGDEGLTHAFRGRERVALQAARTLRVDTQLDPFWHIAHQVGHTVQ